VGIGVKPLLPLSRLKKSSWDFFLAIVSLIVCVPLAAFTIVRCLGRWQFVLLAVWKTTMSFTLAVVGMHRSISLRRANAEGDRSFTIFAWLIVYGLGTIVGLTGLLSLVGQTFRSNHNVQIISYVFGCLILFLSLCIFLAVFLGIRSAKNEEDGKSSMGKIGATGLSAFVSSVGGIMIVGMLAAFYSDWILAAIAHHGWAGAPSDDNMWLYWSYFFAKRLPLASW